MLRMGWHIRFRPVEGHARGARLLTTSKIYGASKSTSSYGINQEKKTALASNCSTPTPSPQLRLAGPCLHGSSRGYRDRNHPTRLPPAARPGPILR